MKYIPFGKTGLRVSQVALGTGNFGTGWGYGAEPDTAESIFNAYDDAGGNFIDTADVYQFGQSEELLGKLLQGRRENFVLATKFTSGSAPNANRLVTGNSRKAMIVSVEASLKRLKTDRIDIYWAHHPDEITPTEEIIRGFEDLARTGKILYAGLSNFSAWRLSRAVTMAELLHTVPIAAAQFEHSLVGSHYTVYSQGGQLLYRQAADGTRTDSVFLGKQLVAEVDNALAGNPPNISGITPTVALKVEATLVGSDCPPKMDCLAVVSSPAHLVTWSSTNASSCSGTVNKSFNGATQGIDILSGTNGRKTYTANGIIYQITLTCTGDGGQTTSQETASGIGGGVEM